MATFFAYDFALLFVGATFTEKIFGWHGMGEWFVDSVTKQRRQLGRRASRLFVGVLVLFAGFLSDIVYAVLDPRVRVELMAAERARHRRAARLRRAAPLPATSGSRVAGLRSCWRCSFLLAFAGPLAHAVAATPTGLQRVPRAARRPTTGSARPRTAATSSR